MKTLTVHERINFKSHYPPSSFYRVSKVDRYGHDSVTGNYKSFEIPFWSELQRFFSGSKFRAKF